MTILASFNPRRGNPAGLNLAAQLALTTGERVIATAIIEQSWPPRIQLSGDYDQLIADRAVAALDEAIRPLRAQFGLEIEPSVHHALSVPDGILEVARKHEASIATFGSSSTGLLGRIALGGVTGRLVHAADMPVMLAPRGYRQILGKVQRLTVGYGGQDETVHFLEAGAKQSQAWGVPMRIACFVVRPMSRFGSVRPTMPNDAPNREDRIIQEWEDATRAQLIQQMAEVRRHVHLPDVEFVVGVGNDWDNAIEDVDWRPGDTLMMGSSAAGRSAQVFLGSAAAKILRHAAVPVMIVPRGQTVTH